MLDTDSRGKQTDYVLIQNEQDGVKKPLSYWSQTLIAADQNYDTMNLEFLSIVWAILLLRRAIEAERLAIWINHDVFKWIFDVACLAALLPVADSV